MSTCTFIKVIIKGKNLAQAEGCFFFFFHDMSGYLLSLYKHYTISQRLKF